MTKNPVRTTAFRLRSSRGLPILELLWACLAGAFLFLGGCSSCPLEATVLDNQAKVRDLGAFENKADQQFTTLTRSITDLGDRLERLDGEKASTDSLNKLYNEITANIAGLRKDLEGRIGPLEANKADASQINDLLAELRSLKTRINGLEYELHNVGNNNQPLAFQRVSEAARNAVLFCLPSMVRKAGPGAGRVVAFVRCGRQGSLTGPPSQLGDLFSSEFAGFLKTRSDWPYDVYSEEQVINIYQSKNMAVPEKERFKLDILEKAGFKAETVLVIYTKLIPTATSVEVGVTVNELKDPGLVVSSRSSIRTDMELKNLYETVLDLGGDKEGIAAPPPLPSPPTGG